MGPAEGRERKHGISFQEAVTCFADPRGLLLEDEVVAQWADGFARPRDLAFEQGTQLRRAERSGGVTFIEE